MYYISCFYSNYLLWNERKQRSCLNILSVKTKHWPTMSDLRQLRLKQYVYRKSIPYQSLSIYILKYHYNGLYSLFLWELSAMTPKKVQVLHLYTSIFELNTDDYSRQQVTTPEVMSMVNLIHANRVAYIYIYFRIITIFYIVVFMGIVCYDTKAIIPIIRYIIYK